MENRNQTPQNEASAKDAFLRARSARQEYRAAQRERARIAEEKRLHRNAWLKTVLLRTCVLFTVISITEFFAYWLLVHPSTGQSVDHMLQGGISVKGHLLFFLASAVTTLCYSLLLYKHPIKKPGTVSAYVRRVSVWFTGLTVLLLVTHGIYLDLIYNPYLGIASPLFRGPSFLLTLSCLGFSVFIDLVNHIYRSKKLPIPVRIFLHLSLTLILVTLFFNIVAQLFAASSDFFVFLAIFTVLYLAVSITYFTVVHIKYKTENDNLEYESVYAIKDSEKSKKNTKK